MGSQVGALERYRSASGIDIFGLHVPIMSPIRAAAMTELEEISGLANCHGGCNVSEAVQGFQRGVILNEMLTLEQKGRKSKHRSLQ